MRTRKFRWLLLVQLAFLFIAVALLAASVLVMWPTKPSPEERAAKSARATAMEEILCHVKFPAVVVTDSPTLLAIVNPIGPREDGTEMFLVKYMGAGRDHLSRKELTETIVLIAGRDESEKVAEIFYWYYYDRWQ